MYPILFEIGGFPVYTYGVLLAAAYLLGLQFALVRARARGLDEEHVHRLLGGHALQAGAHEGDVPGQVARPAQAVADAELQRRHQHHVHAVRLLAEHQVHAHIEVEHPLDAQAADRPAGDSRESFTHCDGKFYGRIAGRSSSVSVASIRHPAGVERTVVSVTAGPNLGSSSFR